MYNQTSSPKIQMSLLISLEDREWIVSQSNKKGISYSKYIKQLIDKDRNNKKEE